jgi:hypothetical protein
LSEIETFEDHIHLNTTGPAMETITKLIREQIASTDLTSTPLPPQPTASQPTTKATYQTQTTNETLTNPQANPPRSTKAFAKTFTVPKNKSGRVIGARQLGIQNLQQAHGIEITYLSVPNSDPVFKVTGQRQDVLQTETEIHQIAQNTQPFYKPQKRNIFQNQQPPQNNNQECDCEDCQPPPRTQCRSLLNQSTSSYPTTPRPQWAQSPTCKRPKFT